MKDEVKFDYSRVKPSAMAKVRMLPKQVQNEIARKLSDSNLTVGAFIKISDHSKYYIRLVKQDDTMVLADVTQKMPGVDLSKLRI